MSRWLSNRSQAHPLAGYKAIDELRKTTRTRTRTRTIGMEAGQIQVAFIQKLRICLIKGGQAHGSLTSGTLLPVGNTRDKLREIAPCIDYDSQNVTYNFPFLVRACASLPPLFCRRQTIWELPCHPEQLVQCARYKVPSPADASVRFNSSAASSNHPQIFH